MICLRQLEDKLIHHCHLRSFIKHLLVNSSIVNALKDEEMILFNSCFDNILRIAIFYHLHIWMSRNTEIWLVIRNLSSTAKKVASVGQMVFRCGHDHMRTKLYGNYLPNKDILWVDLFWSMNKCTAIMNIITT